MKSLFALGLTILFLVASTAFCFTPTGDFETESVVIPYYDDQPGFLSSLSPVSGLDREWSDFIRRNGPWVARRNMISGVIRRGWGGSVNIGIPTDEVSARRLSLSFLQSESDLLGIPVEDLVPVSAFHRLNRWFVHFSQQYRGVNVYSSRITVVISERGNVVLFGCDYFPDIEINTFPSLGKEAAMATASFGMRQADDLRFTDPEMVIFALPAEDGFDYRLAYRMEMMDEQPSRWLTIVDAHSGEVLYRKNLIRYDTVDGYISGLIFEATPFDPYVSMPFEFERVQIDGLDDIYSDTSGYFTGDVDGPDARELNTMLTGYFVTVNNIGGADASYSDSITPGETLWIEWDDLVSRADERNCYFHTNVIHDFINAIDPGFTLLDYPLPCNVNLNQTCNAYWDGSSINFFREGGGCSNTGEIADVIYHEYGHGITDYQYRPYSPSGAQHEGWSDYIAATITDQPLIGRGFFGEGSYIRTVDNTNRYPDDWTGEPHNDGLIIAGALWDLREALDPRKTYCDTLFHFARYGYSTNYEDYLVDILIVDDDDDDLFNGTPNSTLIYEAFDLHGIGPGDRILIQHEPLEDTEDDANPYPVTALITYTITPIDEDSLFVFYRVDRDQEYQPIQLIATGEPAEYAADIPPQPLGTLVEYYISVTDVSGGDFFSPENAPARTHFFAVGTPTMIVFDDLETETGWRVGAPDDDAVTGVWERVDPIGTYSDADPIFPYQPEDDHTPDPGIYCFITGQHTPGQGNGFNDVDSGKTTLLSPVYDLSGEEISIVEYFRWYTIRTSIDDSFFVDISNDAGDSWTSLEIVTSTENYWKKSRFLVNQFVEPTSQVQLRFIAVDEPPSSLVEAGVDDFAIYSFAPTGTEDSPATHIPIRFALRQNYPNPFNGKTEISFDLPASSDVELSIYDIVGRLVSQYTMTNLEAGTHSLTWDGYDHFGNCVASGIYLYSVKTDRFSQTKKMLYLK